LPFNILASTEVHNEFIHSFYCYSAGSDCYFTVPHKHLLSLKQGFPPRMPISLYMCTSLQGIAKSLQTQGLCIS